ncbi:hypothetical protein MARPU_06840 [Marichromatium purpuratum 984]|uniref:Uncharacterized protein n=1 Tax=Marichromatium purpuratum 984 TaxID=765910 RepID=W0E269_MARPU|nr:hypothetical protein MARPU_06840 [Marichromatium purpuratum 984]
MRPSCRRGSIRWSLVAGRWSLVAGRWSLVAGRWSLVAGRWRHYNQVLRCDICQCVSVVPDSRLYDLLILSLDSRRPADVRRPGVESIGVPR